MTDKDSNAPEGPRLFHNQLVETIFNRYVGLIDRTGVDRVDKFLSQNQDQVVFDLGVLLSYIHWLETRG